MKERLGILISGGGTTMAEIIKACQSNEIPKTEVACVIASKDGIGGMEKARKLSIPNENIVVINPKDYKNGNGEIDQDAFGKDLLKELKLRGVSIVTQNGWLPLTPENVINAYSDAIFNQHPGPVPEFGGKGMFGRRVHAAVLLFNRETKQENPYTEVIGQRVHKKFDQGMVIKSAQIPIFDTDTVDDLQQRALPIEHRVQIEMIKDVVKGNVKEVKKVERLALFQHKDVLCRAKQAATHLYPSG